MDMTQANPWGALASAPTGQDPDDQTSGANDAAQAVQGYKMLVGAGKMDPNEGLDRLKKAGYVHPDTQVEDVLPQAKPPSVAVSDASQNTAPQSPLQVGAQNDPSGAVSFLMNAGMQPMKKAEEQATSSNQDKHTVTSQKFDPGEYALRQKMAEGYAVPQETDMMGEPAVDAKGAKLFDLSKATADPNAPVQKQSADIQKMQDLLKMQMDSEANLPMASRVNWAPLMNFANSMEPERNKVSQEGNTAPMSPDQIRDKLMAYQQKIMDDKSNLQKSIYENMKGTQPTLTFQDIAAQANGAKSEDTNTTGMNPFVQKLAQLIQGGYRIGQGDERIGQGDTRIGQGQQRINQGASIQAQNTVNKDPILNTAQTRIGGADKILKLMNASDDGTVQSNQSMLGQLNAEIARLETGSQSPGLGAVEKTEMEDFAAKVSNIRDTLTGAVTPVDLKAKFQQARGMVGDLRKSYVDIANQRMGVLKSGALPNQQSTYNAKGAGLDMNYANPPPVAAPKVPPAPQGMVNLVKNGQVISFPAANVEKAKARGYQEVQ